MDPRSRRRQEAEFKASTLHSVVCSQCLRQSHFAVNNALKQLMMKPWLKNKNTHSHRFKISCTNHCTRKHKNA